MLPQIAFVIPGDLNTRTGGYRYDKRIVDGLNDEGWSIQLVSLDGEFPFPTDNQLKAASRQLDQIPDGTTTIVDGLAFGAMPDVVAQHGDRLYFIALVHHPLALETGLNSTESALLEQRETQALQHARHVVTTSHTTADALSEYAVPADRITPVLPGTDTAPLSAMSQEPPWRLLCVATITARKGHDILVTALAQLAPIKWNLTFAGSIGREPDTYNQLHELIERLGLSSRIEFTGEVGDAALSSLYNGADLFTLASWHEGYGMVLDEAIARGLPIVCTRGGAMEQTVPAGAGILVDPGDPSELSLALKSFMTDDSCRQSMRHAACMARTQQRRWSLAISEFSKAIRHE